MLANTKPFLLYLVMLITFVVAVAVVVGGTIWVIAKIRKSKSLYSKKVILYTVAAIVIAAISWILNMGWIRFFMTFLGIPFIHGIVFFLANMFFAKYTDRSRGMSALNLWFVISYLVVYLLLPDGGDYGEAYFFFGLIQSDALSGVAGLISNAAIVAHIVLFVLQIISMRKIKTSIAKNNSYVEDEHERD